MSSFPQKFIRACQLSVEVKSDFVNQINPQNTNNIVIPPEFSIEFEITRNNLGSSQTSTFKIYNLGSAIRKLIYADQVDVANNPFRAIQFRAGYVGFTPLIFNGSMRKAYSQRQGVDMITTIEGYDGGLAMAAGFTSSTVVAGIPLSDVLANLATSLPSTKGTPIIGGFTGTTGRGKVLFGNTWNIIRQESDNLAFIDNGQVKILQPNEAIASDISVISSASGLLDSPARSGQLIELNMLFEPRLTVGQIVQLDSTTNALYNGTYKVVGFTHSGMISPAVAGEAKTKVQLWLGTNSIKLIEGTAIT